MTEDERSLIKAKIHRDAFRGLFPIERGFEVYLRQQLGPKGISLVICDVDSSWRDAGPRLLVLKLWKGYEWTRRARVVAPVDEDDFYDRLRLVVVRARIEEVDCE